MAIKCPTGYSGTIYIYIENHKIRDLTQFEMQNRQQQGKVFANINVLFHKFWLENRRVEFRVTVCLTGGKSTQLKTQELQSTYTHTHTQNDNH